MVVNVLTRNAQEAVDSREPTTMPRDPSERTGRTNQWQEGTVREWNMKRPTGVHWNECLEALHHAGIIRQGTPREDLEPSLEISVG